MTRDEVLTMCAAGATLSVPDAGRAWDLGTNTSYERVKSGDFPVPVVRVGRKLRVRSADVLAALGLDLVAS